MLPAGVTYVSDNAASNGFNDGAGNDDTYVAAILPVSHGSLPADEMGMGFTGDEQEDFINNFDSYILNVAQQLDAQSPDSFLPDLTLLDAMLQSLMFE